MITTEDLHNAADSITTATSFESYGFAPGAVEQFFADSAFHPGLDEVALAYGILIGTVVASRDNGATINTINQPKEQ